MEKMQYPLTHTHDDTGKVEKSFLLFLFDFWIILVVFLETHILTYVFCSSNVGLGVDLYQNYSAAVKIIGIMCL